MKKNEKGFLLLEALIALGVLSIAFTALAALISQALLVSDKAGKQLKTITAMEDFLLAIERGEVTNEMERLLEKQNCENDYCYYDLMGRRVFMREGILS